jgi:mannose-1-phosphate guanylyltransferase
MCGGAGARLWPASRETMPKQFIPLFSDLSTFQMTARKGGRSQRADRHVARHVSGEVQDHSAAPAGDQRRRVSLAAS